MIGWFRRKTMPTMRQSSVVVPTMGKRASALPTARVKAILSGVMPWVSWWTMGVTQTPLPPGWLARGGRSEPMGVSGTGKEGVKGRSFPIAEHKGSGLESGLGNHGKTIVLT